MGIFYRYSNYQTNLSLFEKIIDERRFYFYDTQATSELAQNNWLTEANENQSCT